MSETLSFYFAQGNGVIEAPGEIDVYAVELAAGVTYTVAVSGETTGGGTLDDPGVLLLDANLNPLAGQDDSEQLGLDLHWSFTVDQSGTYYIGVTDFFGGVGDYTAVLGEGSGVWG